MAWVGREPFPYIFLLLLRRLACWVLHPVSGSSRWGCVCSLGDSVLTLIAFPYLRVGELLAWGVYGVSCCEVCSLGCPSWLVFLFMCLSFTCSWVGVVWSQVCGPTCSSCVLGSSEVSVAPFCRLSLWPHPLLMFSRLGFFLGRLLGLGLVGCGPAWVPAFCFGELSFPCPDFRLAVPAVWLSRLLVFSWNLYLGSFLSLPVFADGLGWLRLILGCPPFVAWQWRLLPWFFVRCLSACPRGAAVPLDSLVLRCSWSSRWGHLSQVGTVFFLSPRS